MPFQRPSIFAGQFGPYGTHHRRTAHLDQLGIDSNLAARHQLTSLPVIEPRQGNRHLADMGHNIPVKRRLAPSDQPLHHGWTYATDIDRHERFAHPAHSESNSRRHALLRQPGFIRCRDPHDA
ncbi:hypothetical protein D9M68_907910 [compost metagenome]